MDDFFDLGFWDLKIDTDIPYAALPVIMDEVAHNMMTRALEVTGIVRSIRHDRVCVWLTRDLADNTRRWHRDGIFADDYNPGGWIGLWVSEAPTQVVRYDTRNIEVSSGEQKVMFFSGFELEEDIIPMEAKHLYIWRNAHFAHRTPPDAQRTRLLSKVL